MFTSFSRRYDNFIIGYSYKTNYVPSLLKEMSKLVAYAEVVSKIVYDLALKIGVKPHNIIFNGPLKTYEDIALALEGNSIINLDSLYEIEYVRIYGLNNLEDQYSAGFHENFLTSVGSVISF